MSMRLLAAYEHAPGSTGCLLACAYWLPMSMRLLAAYEHAPTGCL
jgi:hypothetical protein